MENLEEQKEYMNKKNLINLLVENGFLKKEEILDSKANERNFKILEYSDDVVDEFLNFMIDKKENSNEKNSHEKENEPKLLLSLKDVEDFHGKLSLLGRTNIKGLAVPASLSDTALKTELRRIIAHMSKEKKEKLEGGSDTERLEFFLKNKKLLKDLVRMYDVGYGKGKDEGEENGK